MVNTSEFEGFPNTFIQAWMRRVTVLSLSVDPGNVMSRKGIGLKSGSYLNLCRDLDRLRFEKRLLETIGIQAEAYALAYHSQSVMATRFNSILKNLNNSKPQISIR